MTDLNKIPNNEKIAFTQIPEDIQTVLSKIYKASLNVKPEDHELTLNTIEELGGVHAAYDEIVKSAGCLLRVLIEAEEKQFLNIVRSKEQRY